MSIDGDLWHGISKRKDQTKVEWSALTSGLADDRSPKWFPNGQKILFASNRSGKFQLYTYDLKEGKIDFWLPGDQHQSAPDIANNGTVVWVKDIGPKASIWIKEKDQEARELSPEPGSKYSPAIHPDGQQVLYVLEKGRSQQLLSRPLKGKSTTVSTQNRPELPVWSNKGDRIIYTSRTGKGALWLTDAKGSFQNQVYTGKYQASWASGDDQLAITPLRERGPYHNGDQDVKGLRYLELPYAKSSGFSFIKAPQLPTRQVVQKVEVPEVPIIAQIQNQFQEVTTHLDVKYQKAPMESQTQWENLKSSYQKKLSNIKDLEEGERLIYQMLQEKPFLRVEKKGASAVSSAHPLASAAGTEILEKGGNVVDAAIAVSFALGVVEPDASGMGGYGEMLIYLKGMDAPTCIEFLTRVPEAASLTNGALNPLPQGGPVMVNIPGTVAGMELAWKRYGSKKVEWADILAPAIRLAEEGYLLDASFATTLYKEQAQYLKYPSSKALFFQEDQPLQPGVLFKNPDLAWTLKEVAKGGADAFYKGAVAEKMVKDLNSHGNVMTKLDMARYYAVERVPVTTTYRGHTVYSGPPPVSGGAGLVGQLNQLEAYTNPQNYQNDPAALHALIEAWKLTPSGRGKIADPGLWPVDLSAFNDKAAAQKRWSTCFDPTQALAPGKACEDTRSSMSWGAEKVLDAKYNTGTTAFAVADGAGNMVSVTQTLGTWGGNFYVTPGLGFLYNDKLGSYSTNPNSFNARVPFARNVTSITPTLVFKGTEPGEKESLLAVGAAGNAWITSAVYHIVTGVIDNGLSPQAAIEQPRVLVGVQRNRSNPSVIQSVRIQMEDGFAPEVLKTLKQMGHDIQLISRRGELRMGYSAAVLVKNGGVIAGGDPRRSGAAMVVEK
ncbi:MAG: hypothetical protein Sapg2KO_34420 [Saprospiraceae bacterium]